MPHHITNHQQAPANRHYETPIEAAYSFSEFNECGSWSNNKVWLDILFVHPQNNEPASVRIAKPNVILHQPREVVEAIVHREVRSFLQIPISTYDYV